MTVRSWRRKYLPHAAATAAVALFLYMALHTLPAVYDNKMSQAAIGRIAQAKLRPDDDLCILRKPELSFPLYAGRRQAVTLNKSHGGWTDDAQRLAQSGKPFLCLAQEAGDKEQIEQFFRRPVYVIASRGPLTLLGDRPPTPDARPAKGSP